MQLEKLQAWRAPRAAPLGTHCGHAAIGAPAPWKHPACGAPGPQPIRRRSPGPTWTRSRGGPSGACAWQDRPALTWRSTSRNRTGAPRGVHIRRSRFEALGWEGGPDQRSRAESILSARRAVPCLVPRVRPYCRPRTVPCRARVPRRALFGSSNAFEVPLACCAVPFRACVPCRTVS